MPQNPDGTPAESASMLMKSMLSDLNTPTVAVGTLVDRLAHRSFGGVIILLSVIGLLPGISVLAGITIFVLAIQMILGYPTPRLPRIIVERKISARKLRDLMNKPLLYIGKLEKVIKPRLAMFTTSRAMRYIGVVVACLSIVMITPLPLSNLLPAIALLLISLGLLENDGIMVLSGFVASIFAMTIGIVIIGIIYESVLKLIQTI